MSSNNDMNTHFETWDDEHLELKLDVLRGILSHGFETPSPIQQKSIIPMYMGKDIIAQAQSGTGKTGAFTIGSLQRIDENEQTTQCIVLSPTRELALQNFNVFNDLSNYMDVHIHLMIGGSSIEEERRQLKNKCPQVIVGTPGRIFDMLRRDYISSKNVKILVMDEADEMLSFGFKEQIYNIFQYMPNDVQVGLFSATMPDEVKELTKNFMRDPVQILVKSDMLTLEGIEQYYVNIQDDQQKYMTLKDIFETISLTQTIIYCNSVKRVEYLTKAMTQDNFPVVCIHGSMDHEERMNTFKEFKSGKYRVLISSDVTARGIDVQQVSVVINFDIPKNKHTYLHRIGRSGRWGRKGLAINFVAKKDNTYIKEIENWYQTEIQELPENYKEKIRYK